MNKYYFGVNEYKSQQVIAENLEEAKLEFALMCDEVGKYAYTEWKNLIGYYNEPLKVPYGFNKDGNKNEYYTDHEFWQIIPIREKYSNSEIIGNINTTEISLLQQQVSNQIAYKPSSEKLSSTTEVSNSMQKMALSLRQNSLMLLRNKKELAYKQRSMALQSNKQNYEMRILQKETEQLNKKIDIMKIYNGLGNDIIQIHKGEISTKKQIDIFQSIRYMKEEIEMLSDFEDFDFQSMNDFDIWLSQNYKEIMPSECSIQIFKVSREKINYGESMNIFQQNDADEANSKKWIIIRNGDNVFRLFNTYKINENFFNSEKDNMTFFEDKKNIIIDAIESIDTEEDSKKQYRYQGLNNINLYPASKYVVKTNEELEELYEKCLFNYNEEIKRRKEFIDSTLTPLGNEIDLDDWRWGKSLLEVKKDYFEEYTNTLMFSLIKESYNDKRYKDMVILSHDIKYSTYYSNSSSPFDFIIETIKEEEVEEYLSKGYELGRKNYKSLEYKEINSGDSSIYDICLFDVDYIKENCKKSFEKVLKETNDKNALENFHALAIIQNILDKKFIFPNHNGIDLIYGTNMELINPVFDNENLLTDKSEEEFNKWKEKNFDDITKYKKGDIVFILKNYTLDMEYTHYSSEKVYKYISKFEDKYKIVKGVITSVSKSKNTIKVKADLDIYTRDNYEKNISYGDPKSTTQEFKIGEWTKANIGRTYNKYDYSHIAIPKLDISEYKKWLHKRLFREKYYNSWGKIFKLILKKF